MYLNPSGVIFFNSNLSVFNNSNSINSTKFLKASENNC
jgi:hypothetical protein